MLYSREDILRNFSKNDYLKGITYMNEGRVSSIIFDEENRTLASMVRGQGSNSYRVQIKISNQAPIVFSGTCSCPVGMGCKHIIATLLESMNLVSEPAENQSLAREIPLSYQLESWIQSLKNTGQQPNISSNEKKFIIYLIDKGGDGFAFKISPVVTFIIRTGEFSKTRKLCNSDYDYSFSCYAQGDDLSIIKMIGSLSKDSRYSSHSEYKIPSGRVANILFDLLIETGRCYLPDVRFPSDALIKGEPRKSALSWQSGSNGIQTIGIKDSLLPVLLDPFRYICVQTKQVGFLDLGLSSQQAVSLLSAPEIPPDKSSAVAKRLKTALGSEAENLIPTAFPVKTVDSSPVPILTLKSLSAQFRLRNRKTTETIAYASLAFNYDGTSCQYDSGDHKIQKFKNGIVHIIERDGIKEKALLDHLKSFGFTMTIRELYEYFQMNTNNWDALTIREHVEELLKRKKSSELWTTFVNYEIPKLKKLGWQVKIDKDFPYNIINDPQDWYANVVEGAGIEWFDIELGVTVDGERINLAPILISILKQNPDIFKRLNELDERDGFFLPLKDGRRLSVNVGRIKTILTTIHQLFSFQSSEGMKLNTIDAALLAEMEAATKALGVRWFGGEALRSLGKRLKDFKSIDVILPPKAFCGELRPYQQDGLNWLQFLREYKLAGILADDMGLGKTVQILAHIATEKECGRLNSPFLVIAPTSLMFNWKMEAGRFTPHLKVLILHGSYRKSHFQTLQNYDIILTTYPLLLRDKNELLSYSYHTIVLDEAQTIKNSNAKMTQITNQLKAEHRLCMTGTPLENHLGELWSLFNFLLPGYLGTSKKFAEVYKTPIEKNGDLDRGRSLSMRIKPFVLRRTKKNVAAELPGKTEIIHRVEVKGTQRDLYEAIRVSMQQKVQNEIQAHGVEKSHIIVLDALLKLRQVCCDPSLLKIIQNQVDENTPSAKLDELISLLIRMIDEERKIIIFSQFTSMLSLIEKRLEKNNIPYVILTGQTKDRETPISQFQQGSVQVFLISLKAGGVGLNLTAADTVIHYDPWWNPAVENQATDRAYRIGQEKPVFVYKLIARETVEEKILEMQERKAKLMNALFDSTIKSVSKLTANDIQALFQNNL